MRSITGCSTPDASAVAWARRRAIEPAAIELQRLIRGFPQRLHGRLRMWINAVRCERQRRSA